MRKTYAELREAITYDNLIDELHQDFMEIPDHRAPNVVHSLEDILMSGYAIFTMKYPSMLCFEQQTSKEQENLKQLFGIQKICSDAQMRRVLDEIEPSKIQALFPKRFALLKKLGVLSDYRFLKKYLLISIDGVHYFESKKVNCPRCIEKKHRDGTISYNHSMLGAALVHPDRKEVFTLGGEAIEKQDGQTKNDCEINASKRLQSNLYENYKDQSFVIIEDALYANEPHIKQIQDNKWDFIINVKPSSHKVLFTLFEARKARNQLKCHIIHEGKTTHHFYWMNNVPLNGQGNVRVNFLYYEQHSPNGKIKRFSWVTSIKMRKSNVYEIMRGGRARWKIENEGFNTLKNQGYNFEHNYGHGYNHLCNVLAHLMLLAFLIDQMVQKFNRVFKLVWNKASSKMSLWERIRAVYLTKIVNSFKELFLILTDIYEIQLE